MDSYTGSGPRKFISFRSGEPRKEIVVPTTQNDTVAASTSNDPNVFQVENSVVPVEETIQIDTSPVMENSSDVIDVPVETLPPTNTSRSVEQDSGEGKEPEGHTTHPTGVLQTTGEMNTVQEIPLQAILTLTSANHPVPLRPW